MLIGFTNVGLGAVLRMTLAVMRAVRPETEIKMIIIEGGDFLAYLCTLHITLALEALFIIMAKSAVEADSDVSIQPMYNLSHRDAR